MVIQSFDMIIHLVYYSTVPSDLLPIEEMEAILKTEKENEALEMKEEAEEDQQTVSEDEDDKCLDDVPRKR